MAQFHNKPLVTRMPDFIQSAAMHLVSDKPLKYDNLSHLIRVATIKLLIEEGYYKPQPIKSTEGRVFKDGD